MWSSANVQTFTVEFKFTNKFTYTFIANAKSSDVSRFSKINKASNVYQLSVLEVFFFNFDLSYANNITFISFISINIYICLSILCAYLLFKFACSSTSPSKIV